MNKPTAPTCTNCGTPDGGQPHRNWQCIRALADRVAKLERWHPAEPWTAPAPAEPVREKPVLKYVPLCMRCGQGAAGFVCSPDDPVLDCHLCGFKSRGRLFSPFPTVEAPRCDGVYLESHGYRCMFEAANQQCSLDATRCYRVNERGFQCCDKHRPTLNPPAANAEPERCKHEWRTAVEMEPFCRHCGEPQPIPPRPEGQGVHGNYPATTARDPADAPVDREEYEKLERARPEGQGIVVVTHDDARAVVYAVDGDAPNVLCAYIAQAEAREQAQAAEIADHVATTDSLLREINAARVCEGTLRAELAAEREGVNHLRAELAALKQPVPAPVETDDDEPICVVDGCTQDKCPARMKAPVETAGSNRDTCAHGNQDWTRCAPCLASRGPVQAAVAMATSGCSEDDGCVDPEHDHSENRKRAVEFFDGLREAGHDLDGVFDDEEDEAAIYGVLTALLDDVSRDALERMREIVALLTFEPTGDEDVTACAKCHSMVTVRDGSEWEDGDICDSCAHDVLDAVRARALASLGGGR